MEIYSSAQFQSIDSAASLNEARNLVVEYLARGLRYLKSSPDKAGEIAYQIAGLMGTDFARNLDKNDPIDEILIIAGELECAHGNVETLREEIIKKIEAIL